MERTRTMKLPALVAAIVSLAASIFPASGNPPLKNPLARNPVPGKMGSPPGA